MTRIARIFRYRKLVVIILIIALIIAMLLGGPIFLTSPWKFPYN